MEVIIDNNSVKFFFDNGHVPSLNQISKKGEVSFALTFLNIAEACFTANVKTRRKLAGYLKDFPFSCLLFAPSSIGSMEWDNAPLSFENIVHINKKDNAGFFKSRIHGMITKGMLTTGINELFKARLLTPIYMLRSRNDPSLIMRDVSRLEVFNATGEFEESGEYEETERIYKSMNTSERYGELSRLKGLAPKELTLADFGKLGDYFTQLIGFHCKWLIEKKYGFGVCAECSEKPGRCNYIINSTTITFNLLRDMIRVEGNPTPPVNVMESTTIDIGYSAFMPYVGYFVTNDNTLHRYFNGYFDNGRILKPDEFLDLL